MRSIHLPRKLRPADFAVNAEAANGQVKVRVVHMVSDIITREAQEVLPVSGGTVHADPERDILKLAFVPRHAGAGAPMVGFVKGFGLKSGAVAQSYCWMPRMAIVCVGASEEDMARAINRIRETQGGYVFYDQGELVGELPLPVGGFWAQLSVPETAKRHREIADALHERGCTREQPYLALQTLPCTGMPYFRLVRDGLLDVRTRQVLPMVVE